ncbi:MAG TPA: PSD1 and planctomycete cytochrome C domain-containing protein, partial [Bryobacteraceae bacterium]|nr:PSD1 and planctomycete cytochrome C domain-containing protein [Bryobacteraceae bacterium]
MKVLCFLSVAIPLAAADFTQNVQPILKRCAGCHGPAMQMAGLRMDYPLVVSRAAPKIIERVTSNKPGFRMPPAGPPLSAAEIAVIKSWHAEGAKVPATAAAVTPVTSSHWSFQAIRRPGVPKVRDRKWARNAIDVFILAALEKESLAPSPETSKTTLLRRLSLDLTGLPPSPHEVGEFLKDTRPDAYERAADRLLASPHYGEKWARHWLDLARYADSDGYEKDLVRPYAWRWRNWVINALNADMPFDQFTIEQLAGDLLPNATIEQRVATGFHRNVLANREAGVDRAEARFEQDVNRTNTIATTWLGLTVGCAQCHNHKYDPISQTDYYRLFAFVRNVEERDIDAPLVGEIGPWLLDRPRYQKEREKLLSDYGILEMMPPWEDKLRYHMAHPGADPEWDFAVTEFRGRFDNADKLIHKAPEKRSSKEIERLVNYFVMSAPKPDLLRDKVKAAGIREVREKLSELIRSHTPLTEAMTVVESDTPVKPYLAVRGDFRNKGEEVEPGTLSVLPPLKTNGTPTRLDLARWLVAPANPLTARVAVNRMWQEFFGRGLVRTSEDFGTQGEKPTHPELLDWLAGEFRDNGWSMKRMHRLIVTSAAYRQSSKTRPELRDRDPENRLIARQSRLRLPAELVRDEALAVSGLLDPAVGGESIRPPQPAG